MEGKDMTETMERPGAMRTDGVNKKTPAWRP